MRPPDEPRSSAFTLYLVCLGAFWIGPPLALAGSALAAIGYRGRLREIRSPVPATGRHYPWLFLGWVCVVLAALVPPYALA